MRILCLLCVTAFLALAQPPRTEFEVAAVKPSDHGSPSAEGPFNIGIHIDGAQVRCTYLALKDYVRIAYRLKSYQISGPERTATDRFDISAKLPDGATRAEVPAMLASLLQDRFALKTHLENREMPVYALVVAKSGLKIKEVPTDEANGGAATDVRVESNMGGGATLNLGAGSSLSFDASKLVGRKLAMPVLADQLSRFLDRPVIDKTNLTGRYDIDLEFDPADFRIFRIRAGLSAGIEMPAGALRLLENASDAPLFDALGKLGFKLESQKAPVPITVIDSALRTPTGN
jgi:uncharacterized protein (TIGR03435 family)